MPLITTATIQNSTAGNDVITGTSGADAFIVDNLAGGTGADTFTFGRNDSLLTTQKLYDSNNDGIIGFGGDKKLDTSGSVDGNDEIKMVGVDPSKGVRYLGEKDGYFVYATAVVKPAGSIEGTVNSEEMSATAGVDKFFYDTALGLNLGHDKIHGASHGDFIVTTSKLYDSNNDGIINFGSNGILELPGATGGDITDPDLAPGGKLSIVGFTELTLDHVTSYAGTTYYYYEL